LSVYELFRESFSLRVDLTFVGELSVKPTQTFSNIHLVTHSVLVVYCMYTLHFDLIFVMCIT